VGFKNLEGGQPHFKGKFGEGKSKKKGSPLPRLFWCVAAPKKRYILNLKFGEAKPGRKVSPKPKPLSQLNSPNLFPKTFGCGGFPNWAFLPLTPGVSPQKGLSSPKRRPLKFQNKIF